MLICPICQNRKTNFFHKINNFKYYICNFCHTIFLNPIPDGSKIDRYYKNKFCYTAGNNNEIQIRCQAKAILKKLKKLNPQGIKLLDIGSGFGYFLEEAKNVGYSVEGIEPSRNLALTSINRLIEVNVINSDFATYQQKNLNKKFDFITLIHVIEHIQNPIKMISDALSLLNKNGILYLETPNLHSHLFNFEKQNYTFLTPPDHIWIFSLDSFKSILHKINCIEYSSSYSQSEHLMGIIKTILDKKFFNSNKNSFINQIDNKLVQNKKSNNALANFKYKLFDKLIAPLFTPLLNFGGYGSILELYLRKKR